MNAFEPAIRNWKNQPPAGGWPFTYIAENRQRFFIESHDPKRCVELLTDILRLNKWFISDAHTWAIANAVWTSRDPKRAMAGATLADLPKREDLEPVRKAPSHQPHWDTKPERYGPKVWGALALFGMRFDKRLWDQTIEYVTLILDPHRAPSTGCDKCHSEWRAQCRYHDPDKVVNEQDAAEWVYKVHNAVNQKIGKLPMTWKAAARLHAWKVGV